MASSVVFNVVSFAGSVTTSSREGTASRRPTKRAGATRPALSPLLRRRAASSSHSVLPRAKKEDDEEGEKGWDVGGFFGSDDYDGNESPFVRPEGAPFFASLTDPTVWRLMQETLHAGEIEQILPAKAKLMAENDGWTLVDVRPYPDYCDRHACERTASVFLTIYPYDARGDPTARGAKSAQLYVPMEVNNLARAAKAAATVALFPERLGDKYVNVEENEYFLDEMQEALEWGDKVILYCGTGGVIGQESLDFEDGLQTASLIAAHELAERGWGCENIKHMAGGLGMWDEVEGFDCGEINEE